jgi:hypothetical protein
MVKRGQQFRLGQRDEAFIVDNVVLMFGKRGASSCGFRAM